MDHTIELRRGTRGKMRELRHLFKEGTKFTVDSVLYDHDKTLIEQAFTVNLVLDNDRLITNNPLGEYRGHKSFNLRWFYGERTGKRRKPDGNPWKSPPPDLDSDIRITVHGHA